MIWLFAFIFAIRLRLLRLPSGGCFRVRTTFLICLRRPLKHLCQASTQSFLTRVCLTCSTSSATSTIRSKNARFCNFLRILRFFSCFWDWAYLFCGISNSKQCNYTGFHFMTSIRLNISDLKISRWLVLHFAFIEPRCDLRIQPTLKIVCFCYFLVYLFCWGLSC